MWLDMPALGMDWHEGFTVKDELSGEIVPVGPGQLRAPRSCLRPAHIFTVTRDLA